MSCNWENNTKYPRQGKGQKYKDVYPYREKPPCSEQGGKQGLLFMQGENVDPLPAFWTKELREELMLLNLSKHG